MSYALRQDGGWRSVNSKNDLVEGETWSEVQPPLPAQPNQRIVEIDSLLAYIDLKGARPSREIAAALAAGSPAPTASVQKLTALEAQASTLRAERRTLST